MLERDTADDSNTEDSDVKDDSALLILDKTPVGAWAAEYREFWMLD
jgi:hypothetical protein